MTASERFIQLAAEEASSLQQRAALLALSCAIAVYWARSYVNDEVKGQYGQGLTWATAAIWWRRFFFIYFLPSVLLTEFLIQAAQHTKLFEWPMTEIVPKNRELSESTLTTIYGSIYVATPLLYAIGISRFRASKLEPQPLPSETIDMSKWTQDESGQWFRVTYRKGEDLIYDTTRPYEKRAAGWIQTKRYTKVWGWNAFLSAVCFIIFCSLMVYGNPGGLSFVVVGIVVVASGAWGFIAFLNWLIGGSALARGRENFVGPAPIAPPTLDEALAHATRNDARQPDIDDIERALRAREGRGGDGEPQYKFKA